jgi:hypothetical protein
MIAAFVDFDLSFGLPSIKPTFAIEVKRKKLFLEMKKKKKKANSVFFSLLKRKYG